MAGNGETCPGSGLVFEASGGRFVDEVCRRLVSCAPARPALDSRTCLLQKGAVVDDCDRLVDLDPPVDTVVKVKVFLIQLQWIYRFLANPELGGIGAGIPCPNSVLAPESALESRPRVALSSAQAALNCTPCWKLGS